MLLLWSLVADLLLRPLDSTSFSGIILVRELAQVVNVPLTITHLHGATIPGTVDTGESLITITSFFAVRDCVGMDPYTCMLNFTAIALRPSDGDLSAEFAVMTNSSLNVDVNLTVSIELCHDIHYFCVGITSTDRHSFVEVNATNNVACLQVTGNLLCKPGTSVHILGPTGNTIMDLKRHDTNVGVQYKCKQANHDHQYIHSTAGDLNKRISIFVLCLRAVAIGYQV